MTLKHSPQEAEQPSEVFTTLKCCGNYFLTSSPLNVGIVSYIYFVSNSTRWPTPPTLPLFSALCSVLQAATEREGERQRMEGEREREMRGSRWRTERDGERERWRGEGGGVSSNTSCHLILLKGQQLEIKTKFEINEAHSGGGIRF